MSCWSNFEVQTSKFSSIHLSVCLSVFPWMHGCMHPSIYAYLIQCHKISGIWGHTSISQKYQWKWQNRSTVIWFWQRKMALASGDNKNNSRSQLATKNKFAVASWLVKKSPQQRALQHQSNPHPYIALYLSVVLHLFNVLKIAFLRTPKETSIMPIIWTPFFWLGHSFCKRGVSRDTLFEILSANPGSGLTY